MPMFFQVLFLIDVQMTWIEGGYFFVGDRGLISLMELLKTLKRQKSTTIPHSFVHTFQIYISDIHTYIHSYIHTPIHLQVFIFQQVSSFSFICTSYQYNKRDPRSFIRISFLMSSMDNTNIMSNLTLQQCKWHPNHDRI